MAGGSAVFTRSVTAADSVPPPHPHMRPLPSHPGSVIHALPVATGTCRGATKTGLVPREHLKLDPICRVACFSRSAPGDLIQPGARCASGMWD